MTGQRAGELVAGILARCAASPGRVALEHEGWVWSCGELAQEVGRWRDTVTAMPQEVQCLALEFRHGADGIAALLGVLASGRCAVPVDPRWAAGQKAAIYRLTSALRLDETGIGSVPDGIGASAGGKAPDAAVLYSTSGTNGEPKVVAWPGRTLLKAAQVFGEFFELTPDDRHALITPLSVAAALAQVLGTLLHGGTLVLREARDSSISALADWVQDARITTLQTVPSLFRSLAAARRPVGPYPLLRAVKLGGEGVTAEDAERFGSITRAGAVLVNGLGLTEAGFNVCWRHWRVGEPLAPGPLPVGRAVAGVEITLERAEGALLGDGEGEIVIRSADLADGYWQPNGPGVPRDAGMPGRPELRTGDAGCWTLGGELVLTGRVDRRVKIRGHAVQPEQIEREALRFPGVTAAAVVLDGTGPGTRLLLFVEAPATLSEPGLQRQLALRLPDPARPARVLVRETLPRLAFGKVDRRALVAPRDQAEASAPASPPPRDFLARTLFGLFASALRRKDIPPGVSFFDLGGDSLAAAELFADIERVLGLDLPLVTLRQHPSVEALSRHLLGAGFNPTDHPLALLTPAPDAHALPVFA